MSLGAVDNDQPVAGSFESNSFMMATTDGNTLTIIRKTYSLGRQAIALRISGDPNGNDGLYYIHSDHLGSTTVMSDAGGNEVPGSEARYLPFGDWRVEPAHDLTDQGFTGQKHNMDLGLYYYNARFYLPGIGRFASADTLVPDPKNPQQFNRYTYTLNNPLRYSDPTGHVCYDHTAGPELLGTCIDHEGNTYTLIPSAAALSTPCNDCPWSDQFGDMGRAYQVFVQLEQLLGRSVTTTEVLALVAHHEFGWALRHNQQEYDAALEAMGRQFYNFCGAEGICGGDQLWKFLGAQQAWYAGNAAEFAQELTSGSLPSINFAGAARVLGQPAYDPANATVTQKRANWRSGANVSGVPFKYGNYSMFAREVRSQLAKVDKGLNGLAVTTVYLNRPDLNYGNGYVVMTMGQYEYWTEE